jgi:long-chain acyl-CoA synthetase
MNIASLFVRNGKTLADRPALAEGTRILLTHSQLLERAARIAGHLRGRLGLTTGDRVALVMKNSPAYLELLLAGWYAGLTMVPVNAKLHQREFAYILDHAGARVCFATPDLIEVVAPLADEIETLEQVIEVGSADLAGGEPVPMADVSPASIAWLFYTSGTTGRPKGAMLTHRNLLAMTLSYFIDVDHIVPEDGVLHAAPMSHGSGCYIIPHAAAGACQIIPESGGFDPAEMAELFRAHEGVTLFAAPTMVKRMSQHAAFADWARPAAPGLGKSSPPWPDGLKTIVYGGGPMYLADLDKAHEVFGYRLAQIYGQGESPMCITALDKRAHADVEHPRYPERLQSAGKVQTVMRMRVVDAEGCALPEGEVGEVVARGDAVMAGYWRDEAATAAALKDGWLYTGDVGSLDEDGFLTLRDRSKDLIISGGANIYPREVEEVLLKHPDVAEVSVIGEKDEEWGEAPVAFVVADRGADIDAETLDRFCLDNIARFKRPKHYHLVEALPKNSYGKVLKTALRKRLEASD